MKSSTDVPDRMDGFDPEREEAVQASWPELTCYGCGPASPDGLGLESYLAPEGEGDRLVARVDPDGTLTSGTPNVAYGGYVASLVDCHCVWTAITFAYRAEGRALGSAPRIAYVTGRLTVDYRAPTPLDRTIHLRAWPVEETDRRTTVRCELGPEGETTAAGEVVAVRVAPSTLPDGHHRAGSPRSRDDRRG